eukprot:GHVS01054423.1.p1 GENE.GHVS01054423.1~~GHVS01054423.1.p1  ORF type:complete len:301 (-),score=54.34 GHVS01054423.1:237-1139(-)
MASAPFRIADNDGGEGTAGGGGGGEGGLNRAQIVGNPMCRFYLIKSFNADNVRAALQHGVWATTPRNEQLLAKALQMAPHVVLIFSINASSRFSGYARMVNRPGESRVASGVFMTPDGRPFWGQTFDIEWLSRYELSFSECSNIRNSLNENKPVKIGRDGQEIAGEAARELCDLFGRKERMAAENYDRCSGGAGGRIAEEQNAFVGPYSGPRYIQDYQSCDPYNTATAAVVKQPNTWGAPIGVNQSSSIAVDGDAAKHNPVLQVFPIDLTSMTYNEYRNYYQSSEQGQQQPPHSVTPSLS